MLTLRTTTISLFILLALGLTLWSVLITNQNHPIKLIADHSQPDAFMENIVATIINKEGNPSLKVISPKAVHYPNNDITRIEKPTVTIYRHSPEPWYINSNYAVATKGISQIEFLENVVISHLTDQDNPLTTMKTTNLTFLPEKQLVETNAPITITQPNTIIHATGMLANMNDGTIKLLSQAKGEYVPS